MAPLHSIWIKIATFMPYNAPQKLLKIDPPILWRDQRTLCGIRFSLHWKVYHWGHIKKSSFDFFKWIETMINQIHVYIVRNSLINHSLKNQKLYLTF